MTKNVGGTDKFIRLLFAGIIVILSYLEIIEGTLAITLLAIAGLLVLTSFFNLCPLYLALGKSTCKAEND